MEQKPGRQDIADAGKQVFVEERDQFEYIDCNEVVHSSTEWPWPFLMECPTIVLQLGLGEGSVWFMDLYRSCKGLSLSLKLAANVECTKGLCKTGMRTILRIFDEPKAHVRAYGCRELLRMS